MTRILIVEDEESYREPLAYQLSREHYEVVKAATGEEGWDRFLEGDIDLVLLDLMLPGIDGVTLCKRIREQSRIPIIMVTAKTTEVDTVVGLETGADDYVSKPYAFRELLARIRAVLRRHAQNVVPDVQPQERPSLSAGRVTIFPDSHVVLVEGQEMAFPRREYELLEYFIRNKGRVITRSKLIKRFWGENYVGDTKTLNVHVKRIRAKIETDAAHPVQLVTVRGVGYRMEA